MPKYLLLKHYRGGPDRARYGGGSQSPGSAHYFVASLVVLC